MSSEGDFVLVVTIVKKGWGDDVVKASRKAGARVEQFCLGEVQVYMKTKVSLV